MLNDWYQGNGSYLSTSVYYKFPSILNLISNHICFVKILNYVYVWHFIFLDKIYCICFWRWYKTLHGVIIDVLQVDNEDIKIIQSIKNIWFTERLLSLYLCNLTTTWAWHEYLVFKFGYILILSNIVPLKASQ